MRVVHALKRQLEGSRVTQSLLEAAKEIRNPAVLRKNVGMFHTGRCGSTVLGNMLNQHSAIFWAGEIFERMTNRHREVVPGREAFDTVINKSRRRGRDSGKRIYGFELKYLRQQHLRDEYLNMTLADAIAAMERLRFSRFIVLHRENYLRQAISAEVGRQNKSWHAKANPQKATRVTLDVHAFWTGMRREPLLDWFHCLDENYHRLKDLLADREVLLLSYERDILKDPAQAYGKTCAFLGVAAESPQIDLVRTNPFSYDTMVDNMSQVVAVLRGTQYEWMLDE
jgi:LPS sulfotransferase NodH